MRLHVEEAGSGPPLLLVHGSWTDHHTWDRVFPGLAARFRTIAYDRRGHGQSETAPRATVREHVADLACLIQALDLAPANLVATSFGAIIALRLATERPDLVSGIAAHEPPAFDLLDGDPRHTETLARLRGAIDRVVQQIQAGEPEGAARIFVEEIATGPGAWELMPSSLRASFARHAPAFLAETEGEDVLVLDLEALARSDAVLLLTEGERSRPHLRAVVERLIRAVPRAEHFVFRACGHVPHQSRPDELVRRTIASFAR